MVNSTIRDTTLFFSQEQIAQSLKKEEKIGDVINIICLKAGHDGDEKYDKFCYVLSNLK